VAEADASPTTTEKLEARALAVSCGVRTCATLSPSPRTSSNSVPRCCSISLNPGVVDGTRVMAPPAPRIIRLGPLASLIQPSAPVRSVLPAAMTSRRPTCRGCAPISPSCATAAPAASTTSHWSARRPTARHAAAGGSSNTVSLAVRSLARAGPASDRARAGRARATAAPPPVRRRQRFVGGIERYPVCVLLRRILLQTSRRRNQQGKPFTDTIWKGSPASHGGRRRAAKPQASSSGGSSRRWR